MGHESRRARRIRRIREAGADTSKAWRGAWIDSEGAVVVYAGYAKAVSCWQRMTMRVGRRMYVNVAASALMESARRAVWLLHDDGRGLP